MLPVDLGERCRCSGFVSAAVSPGKEIVVPSTGSGFREAKVNAIERRIRQVDERQQREASSTPALEK